MRRFEYRFEKVLGYKKHIEKQKQRELAQVRQLAEKQKDKIADLLHQRQNNQERKRQLLVGRISTDRLNQYSRYFMLNRQLEVQNRTILRKIEEEVEKRRQILVEATKQRKIYIV